MKTRFKHRWYGKVILLLLFVAQFSFVYSQGVTGAGTSTATPLFPGMASDYKFINTVNPTGTVKFFVTNGTLYNATTGALLPVNTSFNYSAATVKVIWNCGTGPFSITVQHFLISPIPTVYAKTLTLTPLENINQSVNFTKTEMVNSSTMTPVYSKKLFLNHCIQNCFPDVVKSLNTTELRLRFNTGNTYNYGTQTFGKRVNVRVSGYSVMNTPIAPSNTTPLFQFDSIMEINQNTPEELIIINLKNIPNFGSFFPNLYSIDIKINALSGIGVQAVNVDPTLQLLANYAETYDTNVSGSTAQSTTLLSVGPEYAGSQKIKFKWKPSCSNNITPNNWEFQLLRLFNYSGPKATAGLETNITTNVNWDEALSIETESAADSISLHLTQGTGYYIWRVRPIGDGMPGGIANSGNWGAWTSSGAFVQGATNLNANQGTVVQPFGYFYTAVDNDINWTHQRTFGQSDGSGFKLSEGVNYVTSLWQPLQTQTYIQTTNHVLATQTLQDYSGRTKFTSLPAPTGKGYFQYKSAFIQNASGATYSTADFDGNTTYNNPAATNSTCPLSSYYSDSNSDKTIPDCEGYPFVTSLYSMDGQNLVKEQGNVGNTLRIQPVSTKTKKTLYGLATEQELVTVFGDEAPANAALQINIDENGNATGSYISKEGKPIATFLVSGGDPSPTDLLDPVESSTLATTSYTLNKNVTDNPDGLVSQVDLLIANPGTNVIVNYSITPRSIQADCGNYCATCDYKIDFMMLNADDPGLIAFPVQTLTISAKDCSALQTVWSYTYNILSAGTWQVKKIIRTNTIDPATGKLYWEKITNNIKNDIQATIAPYSNALQPYFAADDLDDLDKLNAYLDAQSVIVGSGITYSNATKQYSITPIANTCFTVTIPKRMCNEVNCPEDGNYAKMLYDTWSNDAEVKSSLLLYANEWKEVFFPGQIAPVQPAQLISNGHIDIKYFFPAWMNMAESNLNALVNNMLADQSNFNSDKICEGWFKMVKSYKSIRLNFDLSDGPNGALWTTLGTVQYAFNRKEFNILEFLFNEPTILKHPDTPIKLTQIPLSSATCTNVEAPSYAGNLQNEIDYHVRHAYNTVFVRPVGPDKLRDMVALQNAANAVDMANQQTTAHTYITDSYNANEKDMFCNIYKTYSLDATTFTISPPPQSCFTSTACINAFFMSNPAVQNANFTYDISIKEQDLKDECASGCEKQAFGLTVKLHNYLQNNPDYINAGDPDDINNNSNAVIITSDQLGCMVWKVIDDCKSDCYGVVFPTTPAELQQFLAQGTYSTLTNVMTKSIEIELPEKGACEQGWTTLKETSDNIANQLVTSLNEQLEDFLLLNPGYTGTWDVYSAMVAANPTNAGVNTNKCGRIYVTLNGTLKPYFVVHNDCDLYYVYYTQINLGSKPIFVKDSIRLCNWICEKIPCPAICYKWKPYPTGGLDPIPCGTLILKSIKENYFAQINDIIDSKVKQYKQKYLATCLDPDNIDTHTATYKTGYYHFTLNYFDRAGYLVKTVPPMGVQTPTFNDIFLGRWWHPNHTLFTEYEYNSLGQVIRTKTPDQGETKLYYNSKGMVRFAQNAKQKTAGSYSYTKYDYLGRLIESGQSTQQSNGGLPFTDPAALDNNTFPITANGGITELVQSYFDVPYSSVAGIPQNFLRNRIAQAISDRDGNLATYNDQTSTYFSYDAHGNVELTAQITGQNINAFCLSCLGINTTVHKYDVVSGKILETQYNAGKPDAFYHRYTYDADNRLLTVQTSTDGMLWENNLANQYYPHGPLKREVIGNGVQGLDYVYTLQGWLKGINHPGLISANDPGNDGGVGSTVCPDAYSEMLGYYKGDFKRTNSPFNTAVANTAYLPGEGAAANAGLYNGNISSVVSNMTTPAIAALQYPNLTGNKYRYDKLGRLKTSSFYSFNAAQNAFQYKTGDYDMNLFYDPNGNITLLRRNGMAGASSNNQKAMDDLMYNYLPGTNQLSKVTDAAGSANYTTDIDNQNANNYTYYETGELKTDVLAQLSYTWQSNGKLQTVTNGLTNQKIDFYYDAMGHRTMKVIRNLATNTFILTNYYIYNAGGKVVSIYEYDPAAVNKLVQKEVPVYGGDRIGVYNSGVSK